MGKKGLQGDTRGYKGIQYMGVHIRIHEGMNKRCMKDLINKILGRRERITTWRRIRQVLKISSKIFFQNRREYH